MRGISGGIGGEGGIRTLGTLLTYTHFPGVLLRPLGHLSLGCRGILRGYYSLGNMGIGILSSGGCFFGLPSRFRFEVVGRV